jgi:hypothetical protein
MAACKYVTRNEWLKAESKRLQQRAADIAINSEHRETLNEVKADVKKILAWMNGQIAIDGDRTKTIKEFKALQAWINSIRGTAILGGGIFIALLVALGTMAKIFIFNPIWQHITNTGH